MCTFESNERARIETELDDVRSTGVSMYFRRGVNSYCVTRDRLTAMAARG